MYFEQNGMTITDISDARKEKIDLEKAWELIRTQDRVYIGKGKKVLSFAPKEENREEILKMAMGRSGNLRAPAIKTDAGFFIGYNDLIYENF
jgi:5-keto 4-deoxyuronate isomerase